MGKYRFFICRRAYARNRLEMKNKWVLMLCILLVCGLAFIGCDNGTTDDENTDPKSVTITDVNSSDLGGKSGIIVGLKPTLEQTFDFVAGGGSSVSGTVTVTIQLGNAKGTGFDSTSNWTGSGEYYLVAWNSNGSFSGNPDWATTSKVTFSNAETIVAWSAFSAYTP
jgi:hypothetical protein